MDLIRSNKAARLDSARFLIHFLRSSPIMEINIIKKKGKGKIPAEDPIQILKIRIPYRKL